MEINLSDLMCFKGAKRPLLSLDLGEKRIGVAISDQSWMIASALEVIDHHKFTTSAQRIQDLVSEHNACALVIGLPKNMDGTMGPRTQSIKDFARNFERLYPDVPYLFWDERLSTVAAESLLITADLTRKKRKTVIDKIAATYILQGFLDRLSHC